MKNLLEESTSDIYKSFKIGERNAEKNITQTLDRLYFDSKTKIP